MSNTYPDGAPQTPYGDPNNAAGAEGAPEPQPTQAFPPVPVVPLPGQGAGAPTGAPAAPYGQGGAPYGGAPTAAYGESLAGPQGGAGGGGGSRMDTRRRRMGRSRERTDSRALAPHTTRVGLLMVSSLKPVRTPSASPMAELRMVARRLPPRMVSRLQGRRAATAMRLPRPMVSSPSRSMVPARLPLHTVSRLPAVLREGTVSRPHRTAASSRPPRTDSHTAPTSTVARNTGTSRPQSRRKATAIRTSRNRRRRRAAARSSPASPPVSLPSSPSSS